MPNAGCSNRVVALIVIATLSLTASVTAPSRPSVICPPIAANDARSRNGLPIKSNACRAGAALEPVVLDKVRLENPAFTLAHGPQL